MYSGGNTILPAGLYGSKTWSLILREKRRLRVFENRVLRRNLGLKKDEITGEWIKLHNEELYDLYSSQNTIRVINSRRMGGAGHVACMEDRRGSYRILVEISEGKTPLGRPRGRWEDYIKMYLQEVEEVWTGPTWLRRGKGDELLRMR
jgi:hypothetical protein